MPEEQGALSRSHHRQSPGEGMRNVLPINTAGNPQSSTGCADCMLPID